MSEISNEKLNEIATQLITSTATMALGTRILEAQSSLIDKMEARIKTLEGSVNELLEALAKLPQFPEDQEVPGYAVYEVKVENTVFVRLRDLAAAVRGKVFPS